MLAWFGPVSIALAASTSHETWYQVWIKGERVGYARSVRTETRDEIRHQETISVSLKRATSPVRIWTEETHIETPLGKPLGFELNQRLGGNVTQSRGQWQQDHWHVEQSDGKQWRKVDVTIPAEALLTEGSERLVRAARANGQKTVGFEILDPSSLSAMKVELTLGPLETVASPTGQIKAFRVDQIMRMPGANLASTAWEDEAGNMRYTRMPMLGTEFELVESTKADATPEAIGGDLFHLTTLRAPRVLSHRERAAPMRYWLRVDGDVELPAEAGEQRAQRVDAAHCRLPTDTLSRCFRIDINGPAFRDQTIAGPELKKASSWVQSDDPAIVAFAKEHTKNAKTENERMEALTKAVSARLADKNLSSGYVGASEAFADRSGDCTEHALLLAAAGRAQGIPTRVAAGLAYTDEFMGVRRVFVPHAWTQAYIDGRWQSFDAALGRFDSGHLLLAVGNGDPGMYFASLNALGNLAIARIGKGHVTP